MFVTAFLFGSFQCVGYASHRNLDTGGVVTAPHCGAITTLCAR
jgi:hypothetical protein